MERLQGKLAIVTGAARGLGAASAARLAAEGASVILVDVLAEGDATAAAIREAGRSATFRTLDVTDEAGWRALVAHAESEFGGVDILVNNAGISRPGNIEAITTQTLRQVLEINLIGTFLGMRAVLPAMRKRGGGSIINLSSSSTRNALSFSCAYGASKAALADLTKTTAIHCAQRNDNIRVNSIHPGPHATEMILAGVQSVADDPRIAKIHDAIPLRRLGQPQDVAGAVAFLASDDASYITATELFVDGGLSAI